MLSCRGSFEVLQMTLEALQTARDEAVETYGADWSSPNIAQRWVSDYLYGVFVREDNTVEVAKSLGILDARELYPDVKVEALEEFARRIYRSLA